jgi:hypothetical protein
MSNEEQLGSHYSPLSGAKFVDIVQYLSGGSIG